MPQGKLIIISGPSGAGKGTLVRRLVARVPGLWVSVSATTRPPRSGEVEGRDYYFLSEEEFERRARAGEFLETAVVHGHRYGTLRAPVDERLGQGLHVILEIDWQGARQVKCNAPGAALVFVVAPTWEDLRQRIELRGAETSEEIAIRLRTAEREMRVVGTYDYVVINDDVRRATDELVSIVESLREEQ